MQKRERGFAEHQCAHTLIRFCILTKHCLVISNQISDKASPFISPSGRGQLVEILITLEPHGIF